MVIRAAATETEPHYNIMNPMRWTKKTSTRSGPPKQWDIRNLGAPRGHRNNRYPRQFTDKLDLIINEADRGNVDGRKF
jgi:hypothetical protein